MLGRFRVGEPIGAGAMGSVYTAVDPYLGRTVAIKVLHDEQARPRLVREAKAMARLAHPNVVPIHEIGTSEPLFIVMELVAGGTVRQWLAEPRSIDDIVDVFEQAAQGLAAAHAAGLVHRDFKPENILRGADGRVRVVDFGLVASREDASGDATPAVSDDRAETIDLAHEVSLTHTGLVLGTPAYMAPEQHRGEPADARSDQFGFAVAFYEALYGERPFAGATYREMMRNVYAGTIRPAPADTTVPPAIRAILERALSVAPDARFPSMTALLEALVAATSSTMPTPSTSPTVETPPPRRRWIALAATAGLAAALVVGVSIARSSGSPNAPSATTAPRPALVSPSAAPAAVARPPAAAQHSPVPAPPAEPPPVLSPPATTRATATMTTTTTTTTTTTKAPKQSAARKPEPSSATASSPSATSAPDVVDEAAQRRRKQLELSE